MTQLLDEENTDKGGEEQLQLRPQVGAAAAQLDLLLLGVVADALGRLATVDVVLEFVAVGRLVGGAVLHLGRFDRDLGGEAGAHLVGHDQDHVGVRDELHAEGALAPEVGKQLNNS